MADFGEEYFRTLYGEVPKQTRFDRARDDRVARLVRLHAPPHRQGGALLDIGCGYGYLLRRFRARYRLFGVDVSAHAAGVARVAIPGAVVVTADVQRPLPFRRPFDVILAINVIEHLPDPAAGVTAIHDALVPGGLCVVHLPTINGSVSRMIYRIAYERDPTHVYRPAGPHVRRMFQSSGFETIDESYAPHAPRALWNVLRWHPAYLAAFRRRPVG